jgi:uncharacterized membrane protein
MTPPAVEPPSRRSPLKWLHRSLLSGVAIVLPFAVPIWLGVLFVNFLDGNLVPLLPPQFREAADGLPGVGIVVAFVLVLAVGAMAANFVGRTLLNELEELIDRLPVFGSVYNGVKMLFTHVASPDRKSFKDAVLIEYPQPDCFTVGFVTGDEANPIAPGLVPVYIPFAPIPTSGFVVYTARSKLRPIEAGAEAAITRVLSFGASEPSPIEQTRV